MVARGLDHIVHAVRDLDAAANAYQKLGFTITPTNKHAFGSENRLVQLDGFFIEILSIQKGFGALAPHEGGFFSFAKFNADFLQAREGPSMLVMESHDRDVDLAQMTTAGLHTYDPFEFSRIANLPDGGTATVGFRLGFATEPGLKDNAFFVCEQLAPEHFWKPGFQHHDNGCNAIAAVHVASEEPSSLVPFFSGLAGGVAPQTTDNSVRVVTPRGTICVEKANALADETGIALPDADGLIGMTVATHDFDRAAESASGFPGPRIKDDRIVIPPDNLFGMSLVIARNSG